VLSAFVIAHASKAGRRFRRWWDRRTVRRERIEKIERDIAAFKSEVADVVDCIAPQLADTERERAVLELERLLKEATRAQELAAAIDVKLSTEQQKAEECEQARRKASEVIELATDGGCFLCR
jgi:vacuolar-type H+-ATPase catalytic subunit A/Vma1